MSNPIDTRRFDHHSQSFAWRASSFTSARDYSLLISTAEGDEIVRAVRGLAPGARPQDATKADFPLPTLGPRLDAAYEEVRNGRGFVLLRGIPVESLDRDGFVVAVWGIGLYLGNALSQNANGDLIGHVMDATAEDATPRMYRSNLELRPHNDITGMITLACWQKSQLGGASVIVSAVTVHDEIRQTRPDALEVLYRGLHHSRMGEEAEGAPPATPYRVPVFANVDGEVSCRYLRSNMVAGHKQLGVPISAEEVDAMNVFDNVATAPENRLAFFLERGDMVVLNNYTVMHARTSFTNFSEPERRRHLVRLWLDRPGLRRVPKEFMLHEGTNGVPPQPGKKCDIDFRKLYADDPVATGGVADLRVTDDLAAGS